MKTINKRKIRLDAMARVKEYDKFDKFSKEASIKLRLGMEIYKSREKIGLSQQELARRIETTQRIISRIESGDVNVGIVVLDRLIDGLNLNFKNLANIFQVEVGHSIESVSLADETFCVKNIKKWGMKKLFPAIPCHIEMS